MRERCAIRMCALCVVITVAIVGCGQSSRAATTYDTWQYTVSIPNDLGVTPLNQDPAYVWAHPDVTFSTKTTAIQFDFQVKQAPICDGPAMLALATTLKNRSSVATGSEPVQMTFGTAPGAAFTRTATGIDLTFAVACSGRSSVIALASGLKLADMQAILATFRFRDPSGDPAHPPTAGPSR